jgi:hypothetical protein
MVLAVVLAGCASVAPQPPEGIVKAKAQERWDVLVKGDFGAAYAYLSPGSRQVMSEKDYVARLRKDFWKSAKVESVTCATADACEVSVTIQYEFQGRRTTTPLHENWVREGSEWWYLLRS